MKARTTVAGTRLGARLTALCLGALTLLVPLAVSACSGSGSSSPNIPTFSPSVTISGTVTRTATAPASDGTTTPGSGSTTSGTPGVTSNAPATHTATAIATATVTVTPTATYSTPIPSVAPVTGGGGTAGTQDVLLFGLGTAAILLGAGSIAYRRWLSRDR